MRRFLLHIAICLGLILPGIAAASLPFEKALLPGGNGTAATPAPGKKIPGDEEIPAQREKIAQEIAQLKQALNQAPETAETTGSEPNSQKLQLLEGLDFLYEELLEAHAAQKKVQARLKALETEEAQWKNGAPPKDFKADFATLDRLRGQEVEAKKTARSREQVFKSRQGAVEEAKKAFQAAEQERRRAKEALEVSRDTADRASLEQALAIAQLKSREAELRLALREQELEVAKSYRELFERQGKLQAQEIDFLEKRVRFTEEDLQRELNLVSEESQKATKRLEKQQKELESASKEYERARQRLDASPLPSPALVEEVEARRLAQSSLEQGSELMGDRLRRLSELEDLWQHRFKMLNGKVDKPELGLWQQQTRQYLDQLGREEELFNLRLNSLRNALVENEEKSRAKVDADPETKRWIQQQRQSLQANFDLLQEHLAGLALTRKIQEKFLAEQEARYAHVTFGERLARIWNGFLKVWNYELTSVDDSPITVSKVFIAVILVVFGLLLARRLSRAIAERLLPRFGVAPGVAAALRTLSYYALVLLFFLVALHLVRVPLTLFAVLGGAVAIGIGFGSQTLMNNFISGLILLLERPMKVGDLIQVEQTTGIVDRIGARSTWIRTADNTHFVVPNSSFLEKPLLNWTLSDDMVRSQIRIGVAYGTDTRQAADLLKKAAEGHGKVLKSPPPVVQFSDFGNDALIFDLYFWIRLNAIGNRRDVESDLRFMIDGSFREAQINIAYPQRDVHLDTVKPLDIRLIGDRTAPRSSVPPEV